MKEMVWVVLLALLCCTGLLACRSESAKSALPPLKELTEPWTSLGVVYPVDGARGIVPISMSRLFVVFWMVELP